MRSHDQRSRCPLPIAAAAVADVHGTPSRGKGVHSATDAAYGHMFMTGDPLAKQKKLE